MLIFAEALDVAAEGAVWYARRVGGGRFDALHVAGKNTDSGIHARWFDFTGGEPRLDVARRERPAQVVLDEIARLRERREDVIVTVVLPEQFRKRSLLAAAQRAQFRLKIRLLVEPGVVVADVPAVTSERRPEGHVPDAARRCACSPGSPTRRPCARSSTPRASGADDLRAVHFGERDWSDDDLGIPVDDAPLDGRLGDSILTYVRRLTADPESAVNVVLPERLAGEPAPPAGPAGDRDQALPALRAARDPEQRPAPATRPAAS